jgi:hypothetical protein
MTQPVLPLDIPAKTNGEVNKIDPVDLPVHDWYRFVLSFPPHLVRDYLRKFDLDADPVVLDPFCGTGTTIVECKKLGLAAIGIEALPMPALASRVKTDWTIDPKALVGHATLIADRVLQSLQEQGVPDDPALPVSVRENELQTLPEYSFRLLLKDSISPLPLHKTLVLRNQILADSESRFRGHELVSLAKALVASIGNLKFGPEVGVGKIKDNAFVIQPWMANVRQMARDLEPLHAHVWPRSTIHRADSRDAHRVTSRVPISAVFTSPPYPNEKDYTRTTRLETVVLGLAENMTDLRRSKKELVRSNTRSVYRTDDDDQRVKTNRAIQTIATQIEERRIQLGKTSGFERLYHRVTKLYFGGMARHLASLRHILRPGAYLGYVVGDQASYLRVMIRTGEILSELAETLGYKTEALDLFRTRLATATGEQLREEVLVLRWPG